MEAPEKKEDLPFRVGDKVYDTWDNLCTVIEIDPNAEHGIGVTRTRRDRDGVVLGDGLHAHNLTAATKYSPNQPVQTTPGVITPPTGAGAAPSPSASDR